MADAPLTRSCNNEACGWTGPESETVHPKHDPSMLLCPTCRETTESDEMNVFDWLELEIGGMSCEYHGDPVHTHDAYWMQQQVMRLLKDARKAFPALAATPSPPVAAPPATPVDPDGDAFRTAARLGLTLRMYGGCAQSGMPGSPSAYEVVTGQDPAAAMREAVNRAEAVIANGGEAQRLRPQPQPAQPLTGASWRDGINAAADMLAMKAERFAADHAYNDMGAISFGRGAHAEAKHDYYTSLLELESDVRAMLTAPSTPTPPEVAP